MPVVVVANPKGGAGKTTLSTHIAGYFASRGHAVMLGDVDRQQSSRMWLGLRPAEVHPIASWEVSHNDIVKPPKGTTHVVLDTPGGLHGSRFKEVLKLADKLVVRDREHDDRRVCLECKHFAGHGAGSWRCGNWHAGDVAIRSRYAHLPADLVVQLQRCNGFAARASSIT